MDDLTRIKGIGPAKAQRLAKAGVASFADLAAFEPADPRFASLGVRFADVHGWIAQAKLLAGEAGTPGIAAGSPAREDRQPVQAEAPVSAAAGDPPSAGPEGAVQGAGSEAGAVASAPEPHSADNTPSEKGGGDAPDQGVSTVPPAPEWPLDAPAGGITGLFGMDPVAFARAHPLTVAAIREWSERLGDDEAPTIRIAARRDGFRRCGMAHPKIATDHPAGRFSPDQLEALLAEPNLTVELV